MATYATTKYPTQKDTNEFMQVIDGSTRINSALFSKFSGAILAIEKELGIKPSGIYSDVRQRLDAMETGIADLSIYGASHSTTIATNYDFNWLSPILPGPVITYSTLGKVPINLLKDAGFPDGYGVVWFINRFFVDTDIDWFELSLWETSGTPTEILHHAFTSGEHTYSVLLPLTIDDVDQIYEIRGRQTSSAGVPTFINSNMWNSRFLFMATGSFTGTVQPVLKYISADFDGYDVIDGYQLIGEIPLQGMVQSTAIIIDTPFDGYTEICVGDGVVNDRLMAVAQNIPSIANTYMNSSNYEYLTTTDIYIYFPSGTPTVGNGTVIVYYH